MPELVTSNRESWGTRLGFVLAAAGSAIGLGNIWRFPYMLGENGGSAFLIVYLACILVMGLPIMAAEMAIGRASGKNPVGAFRELAPGSFWWIFGILGLITGTIILSYYSVVAGWTFAYVVKSAAGMTTHHPTAEMAEQAFGSFVSTSWEVVLYQLLFSLATLYVVSRGVKEGIERWSKVLMPSLFVIVVLLIVRAVTLPGSGAGLEFLFKPDFSKIGWNTVFMAMGQAFYSLSLGMGVMITYGSYSSRDVNLLNTTGIVAVLDTGAAVLAGMAIFPALFAMGFAPEAGTGLTFKVLPMVFGKLPGGIFLSTIFFLLLSIAALTSTISLLEVMVSYATDELQWTRTRAALVMAGAAFLLGIPSALSFGWWSGVTVFGKSFFDLADYLTANLLLPIGGIGIALFAGWVWGKKKVEEEMRNGNPNLTFYKLWLWAVRIIAPIAVAAVLVTNLLPKRAEVAPAAEQQMQSPQPALMDTTATEAAE